MKETDEDLSLVDLGLPPRLTHIIEEGLGIVYVADLCDFRQRDLLALPSFGERLLNQVREGLAAKGFYLRDDPRRAEVKPAPRRTEKEPGYSRDTEAFG